MTSVQHFEPLPDLPLAEAMVRGRTDPAFFSHYFLDRQLHDGQCEWVLNADASVNILATANRWGKTTTLAVRHFHKCFYKVDSEPRWMIDGAYDHRAYIATKYLTVHTSGLWDTAALVWHDALKIVTDAPRIGAFISDTPRTLPPTIKFQNGSQWLFRTLGDHGEGIDGKSFYYISIDEAGWVQKLATVMDNVARIRVADVRGQIDIVGTMKPGLSRDFFAYARRASISTGRKIGFDHRDGRDYKEEAGVGR